MALVDACYWAVPWVSLALAAMWRVTPHILFMRRYLLVSGYVFTTAAALHALWCQLCVSLRAPGGGASMYAWRDVQLIVFCGVMWCGVATLAFADAWYGAFVILDAFPDHVAVRTHLVSCVGRVCVAVAVASVPRWGPK